MKGRRPRPLDDGDLKDRVSVKSGRSKLGKWDDLRMKVFSNPTQNEIKIAAKALKDGNLVAFPTETVYGLGADAENEKAVSRIYSVKGRPADHPLIVHISSVNQMSKWAIGIPDYATKLAREFWPGPMTLILERGGLAKDFITGGQKSIGLRVPNQPLAYSLLIEFELLGGKGLAAPSANKFGAVSPTNCEAVVEELGTSLDYDDLILNAGQCEIGLESTIIDCTSNHPSILRSGAITESMIRDATGMSVCLDCNKHKVKVSGQYVSHYSPRAKVIVGKFALPGQGFIALSSVPTPVGVIRLATPETIEEFAKIFYKSLRAADQLGLKHVAVCQPDGDGLANVIRERLSKAAFGRELL